MTQIYLAGKIAKSDWRHHVSAELRDASTDRSYSNSVGDLPDQIGTRYDGVTYVGPFFAGCDHGVRTVATPMHVQEAARTGTAGRGPQRTAWRRSIVPTSSSPGWTNWNPASTAPPTELS